MRPKLFEIVFDVPVALIVIAITLAWSMIQLRWERPLPWGEAMKRALRSLTTFGSAGSTEKTDISVPGSLGTVALALGVYGVVRAPVHLPIFGYAAMAFCGFAATSIAGWFTGPRYGLPPWTAIRVAFLCAFFGILGARLFYAVEFHEQFEDQPARVTFGKLTPGPGETLEVATGGRTAKVVFAGDEKTPSQVIAKLDPFKSVGVHAKLIKLPYRVEDELEYVERGFDVETDVKGPQAQMVLTGTALHDRPGGIPSQGYAIPWTEIFAIWNGGLVWYGGMVFGTMAVLIFVKLQGQRIAQIADLASSVGALGVAFGRVGCFLNGCCWGRRAPNLPWAIRFPLFSPAWVQEAHYTLGADYDPLIGGRQIGGDLHLDPKLADALQHAGGKAAELCTSSWALHPSELYELVLCLGIFAVIFPFSLFKVKREWQTFALWFVMYGVVRFTVEHFRGDHEGFVPIFGYPLTPSQRVSVLTIPFGIALFIWAGRKGRLLERWSPPAASGSPPAEASRP